MTKIPNKHSDQVHPILIATGIYFSSLLLTLLILNIAGIEQFLRHHIDYFILMKLMFVIPIVPTALYFRFKFGKS
jgi:hypothetical protein